MIPALNEEFRLPRTLERTLAHLAVQPYSSAVVVVDNGSVDRTAEVVRSFTGGSIPVHLIGCARRGKGSAVRRGFLTSRSRFVGFMDADLATPVETLDAVVPLLEGGATAVIASRHLRTAARAVPQGTVRRLGGGAFRLAARSVLPSVSDSQCGFKFFRTPEVQAVLPDSLVDGFSFDLEILSRLHRSGHRILEVPVVWTDVGGSTFNPVRHGLRSFSDTIRIHRSTPGRAACQSPRVVIEPTALTAVGEAPPPDPTITTILPAEPLPAPLDPMTLTEAR
ncbi:glycosyltransferase [Kineococcus sp. TBRC 1896]|uniref:Glycosyltransferase n=1 Tax=Kineococcus mangrovi TaxID=1660183 RepID=A0ABV4I127_9ACTN